MFLPTALPLFVIFLLNFPTAVFTTSYPWWGDYPPCTWPYLDAAVPADCAALPTFSLETTQCLCASANFLSTAAHGIGPGCGCSALNISAEVAANICYDYASTLALSPAEFIAAGTPCSNSSASGTSTIPSTTIPTANPSTTSGTTSATAASAKTKGDGGLPTAATAGVSVGAVVIGVMAILFIWFRCFRAKRRPILLHNPYQ